MRTGTQVVKVNRNTGEVLSRGYINPDTSMSEAWAEAYWNNTKNKDPNVGFISMNSERVSDPNYVNARLLAAKTNNECGFNLVLEVTE